MRGQGCPRSNSLFLASLLLVLSATADEPTLPPGADPKQVAQELVQNLRSAVPEEDSVLTGTLKIRARDGATRSVPIECTVRVGEKSWRAGYQTFSSNNAPERLAIVHWPNKANDYFYGHGTNDPQPVAAAKANIPIGGSDFWLTDLGLDFLHWPQQRIIKTEMRKSRWCNVLESINSKPAPGGYGKVISWLDKETGGPILADAFDASGKLLKNFELKSVKKGQLHEISIYNTQTKSTTRLEFDIKPKEEKKTGP